MNKAVVEPSMPVAIQRVNAQLLSLVHGKYVSIIGLFQGQDQSGRSFRLKTPDSQDIVIRMREPIAEALDGYIEVEGIVGANNTIDCQQYLLLGKDGPLVMSNFDMQAFNEAIVLTAQYPEIYETLTDQQYIQ